MWNLWCKVCGAYDSQCNRKNTFLRASPSEDWSAWVDPLTAALAVRLDSKALSMDEHIHASPGARCLLSKLWLWPGNCFFIHFCNLNISYETASRYKIYSAIPRPWFQSLFLPCSLAGGLWASHSLSDRYASEAFLWGMELWYVPICLIQSIVVLLDKQETIEQNCTCRMIYFFQKNPW